MGPRLKLLSVFLILFLLSSGQVFAADRDATTGDLRGIPKSHRYAWAVLGGTAVGAGIGVIAPGGNKSAVKGLLIGGSLTSAFWLAKHPRAAEGKRPFAHIVTNTILGTSVLWTLCDCGGGAWAGALIGGGGTALIQAFGTHHSAIAQGVGGSSDAASQVSGPVVFGNPSFTNSLSGTSGGTTDYLFGQGPAMTRSDLLLRNFGEEQFYEH
jgi:hypothetical protein